VFSALGLLLSPPRTDTALSTLLTSGEGLAVAVADRMAEARRESGPDATVEASVDVRYVGQSHEMTVPVEASDSWDDVCDRFHVAHRRRNGFARPDDPVEVVTVRAVATGAPALRWDDLVPPARGGEAHSGERSIVLSGAVVDAGVWRRDGLAPGDQISGPAIVTEAEATTLLLPGDRATVDESGALLVEW
jgi:N-methylhydantoinase A